MDNAELANLFERWIEILGVGLIQKGAPDVATILLL